MLTHISKTHAKYNGKQYEPHNTNTQLTQNKHIWIISLIGILKTFKTVMKTRFGVSIQSMAKLTDNQKDE